MKCLVCDFGGSSIKYALVDDSANILENGSVPAPLSSITEFQDSIEKIYNLYKDQVSGIAISLPGWVDSDTGYLADAGAYAGILKGKNVVDVVRERCPVPVAIENDGKCGALAEAWKGSLSDCNDGVVIILGSGIGGGVIKDKRIHKGKNFIAGEISFFQVKPGEYNMGNCAYMNIGMMGVTYKLCRAKNLDFSVQDYSEILPMFKSILPQDGYEFNTPPEKIKADGKQFFKWIEEGDEAALKVYNDFLQTLAMMCENIQLVYAPDKIVVGGGLTRADRLIGDLQKEIDKLCTGGGFGGALAPVVVRSEYLDECNILGAMYNYLVHFGG